METVLEFDIVERLRACQGVLTHDPECNCEEAADEIERLRTTLTEALDLLSDGPGGPRRITAMKVISRALEPKP
jgi:hypothetical protein